MQEIEANYSHIQPNEKSMISDFNILDLWVEIVIFFRRLIGYKNCPCCLYPVPKKEIKERPTGAAYIKGEGNYITSCADCHKEIAAHYADMWEDYYSGIL